MLNKLCFRYESNSPFESVLKRDMAGISNQISGNTFTKLPPPNIERRVLQKVHGYMICFDFNAQQAVNNTRNLANY